MMKPTRLTPVFSGRSNSSAANSENIKRGHKSPLLINEEINIDL